MTTPVTDEERENEERENVEARRVIRAVAAQIGESEADTVQAFIGAYTRGRADELADVVAWLPHGRDDVWAKALGRGDHVRGSKKNREVDVFGRFTLMFDLNPFGQDCYEVYERVSERKSKIVYRSWDKDKTIRLLGDLLKSGESEHLGFIDGRKDG